MATWVRECISGRAGSTVTKGPMSRVMTMAVATPMPLAFRARVARGRSPVVVARASTMLGPSSGAITMAPMTMAPLSRERPMVATTVERTVIVR